MCGRYTLKSLPAAIAQTFGVPTPATLPQRFNIAPSQLARAVRAAARTDTPDCVEPMTT